jgi:quercetin dioxygenase-like cupin family protein
LDGPRSGSRIINEHDESDPASDEELYLVVRGRAMLELDGDRVAAPTGTFIFAPPGVKRTSDFDPIRDEPAFKELIERKG